MTETIPADIAAAIETFEFEVGYDLNEVDHDAVRNARAALDAAILAHLRAYDDMKAALERIEAGT